MRKVFFLFVLFSSVSYAQKIELVPVEFYVNYQDLPSIFVPVELRTYNVKVKTGGTIQDFKATKTLADYVKLDGWKRVSDSAAVNVDIELLDFQKKNDDVQKKSVTKKNRFETVDTAYEVFTIVSNYSGIGNAQIKYYSANSTVPAIKETISFSKTIPYSSVENRDLAYLQNENRINEKANFSNRLSEYVQNSLNQVKNKLNEKFGIAAINLNEELLILVSKEEGDAYKTAIDQTVKKLSEMKPDVAITNLESDLEPSIKYLESLKGKYSGSSKTHKTIRYSAYYNLAKIYLYLDQPEKTIVEGEALIKNGFKKEDGEKLVEMGKKLQSKFNLLNIKSTHNPSTK